eukprot:665637-Hanusia_phi.AAC.1
MMPFIRFPSSPSTLKEISANQHSHSLSNPHRVLGDSSPKYREKSCRPPASCIKAHLNEREEQKSRITSAGRQDLSAVSQFLWPAAPTSALELASAQSGAQTG